MQALPAGVWGRTPSRELAILRMPLARFYGEKVLYALLGLAIPPLLTALFTPARRQPAARRPGGRHGWAWRR